MVVVVMVVVVVVICPGEVEIVMGSNEARVGEDS